MRLAVPIAAVVLVAVLVVVWSRSSGDRSGALEAAPTSPAPVGEPDKVTPRAAGSNGPERTGVDLEDAARGEPSPAVERAGAPDARGATATRLLVGLVVDSDSDEPLAGLRLELGGRFGRREPTAVESDAGGRFEVALAPGEYVAIHRPRAGFALPLQPFVVEVPHGTGPVEVTLRARRPPALLDVEVVDEGGHPVAGAHASFDARYEDDPVVDTRVTTDERGRARLPVWSSEQFRQALLRAWDDTGRVSDAVAVDAPLTDFAYRLVLGAGGAAELSVVDADGTPRANLRLALRHELAQVPFVYGDTDAEGRHVFEGLVPGRYTLAYRDEERGYFESWPESLVARHGERVSLEIVLVRDPVEVAASGRVLDEEGEPLPGVELATFPEPGWPDEVRTDEHGEFRIVADGADTVRIAANLSSEGDVYEPAERVVAFGTRGVEFRRVGRARVARFEVEVVDALTGAELESFTAAIDRGPGTERWQNVYAARRSFELRVLDSTRWRIAAHGHVTRALELAPALAELAEGERLRVALQPGLDHTLRVLDLDTERPIGGAVLRSKTAGEARTDGEGRVRLQADHWSVYTVEAEGYEGLTFDPDDQVLWSWGPLYLARPE